MLESIAAMVLKIALGLLGLGVVVFVHELGHFLAARMVGIGVDAFSIGWGKPIFKRKIGEVEYRLGMFPMGGYCTMRGGSELKGVADGQKPEPGTYFGSSPLRRIAVCLAGPFFNIVFAALLFSVVWGGGREFGTFGNRIVLASDLTGVPAPADAAGLRSGDRIVSIDGKPVRYWHEMRETILLNAGRPLALVLERDGETLNLSVTPDLDRNSGAGLIGVLPWKDTLVAGIRPDSDAAIAGLRPGDRIVRVNGEETVNDVQVLRILEGRPGILDVDFVRDGAESGLRVIVSGDGDTGILWPVITYRTPRLSLPAALVRGAEESWRTLAVSVRGLSLLFRGIDLTKAVSGPLRITYMVGDVATSGFGEGLIGGLRSMADFLALISIALGVMNLLPLPVLDGGQIVLFVVEAVRRKPTHPKVLGIFQTAGIVIICALMVFALFGDIVFLGGRLG
ncbi:MAG: RIP metalloprotease RseP [Treponema sp.]|nr:RIP metalloprotease RseP [Treponema sp.]